MHSAFPLSSISNSISIIEMVRILFFLTSSISISTSLVLFIIMLLLQLSAYVSIYVVFMLALS